MEKKIKLDRKTGNARGGKANILHKKNFPFEGISEEGGGEGYSDPRGEVYSEGSGSTKVWNLTFIISKYFYINA